MEFARPQELRLIWLLIPLLALLVFGFMRMKSRLLRFSSLAFLAKQNQLPGRARNIFKIVLQASAFICLVIALAQPRWDFTWQDVKSSGTDIFIVVDVSKSMLASDVNPSRLERAKRKIHDLLEQVGGDRIGIIAFAGSAFVQCPLTGDLHAASMFLDMISADLISEQGSAIGAAIELAVNSLKKSGEGGQNGQSILLITDGEDKDTQPLKAAEKAKEAGIKIFTMGIGSAEGAPIPLAEGGFQKDKNGQVVVSKLDEATLQQMATLTGGVYVRSVSADADIQTIYANGIRRLVNDQVSNTRREKLWDERFASFVAAALLLLLLDFFISPYRRQQRALSQVIGALVLISMACCLLNGKVYAESSDPHSAFKRGDYAKAANEYLNKEIDQPLDLKNAYNRSVSDYFNKNYQRAAEGFAKSAASSDANMRFQSLFNLGNSQARLEKYEDAIKSYQQALQIRQKDKETEENLAWAQQMMQQKKQEQDKKDQENKNQDKQEQDKKDQENKNQDNKNQEKPAEQKPAEQKPAEQKPAEQKPAEQKPAEQKPTEDAQKAEKQNQAQNDNNEKGQNGEKQQDTLKSDKQGEHTAMEKAAQLSKKPKTEDEAAAERLLNAIDDEGKVLVMPQSRQQSEQTLNQEW